MDLTLFVIFWTTSFGVGATSDVYEEGLLVLARAGGRYDPLQIWYGKSKELWATNQCQLDEQDSFRNHCIKGNFRSPRIDDLHTYAFVELEVVVFNKHGDELLSVKGCTMLSPNVSRGMECHQPNRPDTDKVYGKELDRMGGFVLYTSGPNINVLAVMFNYGHYFDNDNIRETVLLPGPGKPHGIPNTGYLGCFPTVSGNPHIQRKMSVEKCISSCKTEHFAAVWHGTNCSCTVRPSGSPNESECQSLCNQNENHICGGEKAFSVYNIPEYQAFKELMKAPPITMIREVQINDSRTTITEKFAASSIRLTHLNIEEDPECNLTNIYFNVSSPLYNVTFFAKSACTEFLKMMPVHADTTAWDLGYIKAACVSITPVPHTCTYHRSTFRFYAIDPTATGQTKEFAFSPINESYIGIRGKWAKEVPTTEATTSTKRTSAQPKDPSKDKGGNLKGTSANTTETGGKSAIGENSAESDGSASTGTGANGGNSTTPNTPTVTSNAKDQSVENKVDGKGAESTSTLATTELSGVDQATSSPEASRGTTPTSKASTESTLPTTTVAPPTTTTPYPTEPDLPSNITTPVPAVREACTCLCVEKPRKNQTKVMVAKEKAIKIHKKLKIDTMNLSSSVRRKVSAPDNRITAAVGGYLGICLLTIALGSLILADITSITRHIRLVRNKNPAPPTKGGK